MQNCCSCTRKGYNKLATMADSPKTLSSEDKALQYDKNKNSAANLAGILDNKWVEAVFNNDTATLKGISEEDLNKKDHRGNSLLMLAILLQNEVLATWLLDQGASVKGNNVAGWDCFSEAVSLGFADLVKRIVKVDRDETEQELDKHKPKFREICDDMKDFYMEIAWDLHTWVPLVSRALPHDTLRIWKQGRRIRVDSDLIDIADGSMKKQQALSRIIEIPQSSDAKPTMYCLDHDKKEYFEQALFSASDLDELCAESESQLDFKCAIARSTPLVDFDVIARDSTVSRVHTGFFGFGEPKAESINGYECDVFQLSNVQAVTRKRKEHLSPQLKAWRNRARRAVQQGDYDLHDFLEQNPPPLETAHISRRRALSLKAYDTMSDDEYVEWLKSPYKERAHTKTFSSTMWMSDEFPLSIERIVSLLSPFTEHNDVVATLVKFLQNKLPPGFPVKLDIPVVPTVTARINFKDFAFEGLDADATAIPKDYALVHDKQGAESSQA